MNEVVIFCMSYPQINNALYIASQNCDTHPITIVIAGDCNLSKFFNVINERVFQNGIKIIFIDVYRGQGSKTGNKIKKALNLLPDLFKEKRYLKSIFNIYLAGLRGADVFFFSRFFCTIDFYFLKKLDKSNRLVYMQSPVYDALAIEQVRPGKLIDLAYLTRWKLAYGYGIVLGKHTLGQKVPIIPDRFFREHVDKVIDQKERDTALRDFDLSRFRVFNVGYYSFIYFHDDLVQYGYISDAKAFLEILNKAFQILKKHFPAENVACKYHPSSDKTMIQFGDVLPDFIPAEFLYNDNVKMYLGLSSMALAHVEKGMVVSLMDMVPFRDDKTRGGLKEIMIRASKSKILFPKSLPEFEQILKGLRDISSA
jgi:hypothetical protein